MKAGIPGQKPNQTSVRRYFGFVVLAAIIAFVLLSAAVYGRGATMLTVLVIAGLLAYFLPTFVAAGLGKRNTVAIFALNLLLGWTAIGWIVSLVWSLTAEQPVR